MKKFILIAVFAVVLFTSCSTIMTGTSENVTFNANVEKAKVYVDGIYRGDTPLILDLESKKSYTIQIEAEGYNSYTTMINKKTSGWVLGNVIIGGVVGIVVDVVTGGIYVLDENEINGNLSIKQVSYLEKKIED